MFHSLDATPSSLTALPAGDPLAFFRRIYDDSLDAALLVGPSGVLHAANGEACSLFGATESALCAASSTGAQALLVDADDPRADALRAQRLASGHARGGLRLRRLDGQLFEAEVALFVLPAAGGQPSAVMTVRDLSALQRAKRLAQDSEARLRFALEAADIGDWDMDLRSNVARRSLRHDQCFGYTEAVPHWGYETFIAHVHADDQARVVASYQTAMAMAPGGDYDVEFRVLWPDGSLHWLWSKGRFYFDAAAQPYRVAGIVVDITRRHAVEAQLRHSEQDLAVTLQSIADAVITTGVDGRITRMNVAAQRLTGWSLAEARLRPLADVFQAVDIDTRRRLIDPVAQVLQTGDVVARHNHAALLARAGVEHQISTSAAPIRAADGDTIGVVLVFSDVSDAYRARAALASAADSLERTSAMARVGGWELDLASMQPTWSPETFRIHEVEPPVTPSLQAALAFYPPQSLAVIQPALQAAMDHGTPCDLEVPLTTATGRQIWVRTQCSAVLEGGKVVRLLGAFHDITDRKLAELALRDSTAFNAAVLDSLSEQIAVLDADGLIVAVNAAWRRRALLGGAPSAQDFGVGTNYLHVCRQAVEQSDGTDTDAAQTLAGMRAVLAGAAPSFHLEYPCHSPTDRLWFRVSVVPMQGSSGGAVVSHTDITERKLAEAALRAGELRYRQLFDSNPQPMWVFDVQSLAFLAVNKAAVAQYGYSREAFLAMTVADLCPPDEALRLRSHISALASGQHHAGRWTHRRQDGSLILVDIVSDALDDGPRPARLVLALDVTEREHAEAVKARLNQELEGYRDHLEELVAMRTAELAAARQQADDANRAKSAFLANMSHEIRTPLNAIVGLNYLIRTGGLSAEQAARFDKIDSAGQHLLSIINDVLDLSKIEAGRVQIETTDFHLSAVLDNVQSIVADAARAKGLQISVDSQGVPMWLRGDPTRLRQTLLNFASNAVKFTEQGQVRLRAKLLRDDGDSLLVRFVVEDTGIGITAAQLPRLFLAFRAGRCVDHAQVRRHRAGPGDQPAAGAPDGWRPAASRAARCRQHLLVHCALAARPWPDAGPPAQPRGRRRRAVAHTPPRRAHPAGRRQRGQSRGGPGHAARCGPAGGRGRRWPRSPGPGTGRPLRPGADGHADARHGRPGGHPRHPPAAGLAAVPHRRPDRQRL